MKKILYILMLLAISASINAQKKGVPAVIVEKKDGTKDTIRLNKSDTNFYGLDNPQDGEYTDFTVSGGRTYRTPQRTYYDLVSLTYTQPVNLYDVRDYGCVITDYPIDRNGVDSIMAKIPASLQL